MMFIELYMYTAVLVSMAIGIIVSSRYEEEV